MKYNLLKQYIESILENINNEENNSDELEVDEASGVGAIAGYVLPLGMTNNNIAVKKKRKK